MELSKNVSNSTERKAKWPPQKLSKITKRVLLNLDNKLVFFKKVLLNFLAAVKMQKDDNDYFQLRLGSKVDFHEDRLAFIFEKIKRLLNGFSCLKLFSLLMREK